MAKGVMRFKNMTVGKQQGELARLRVLGGPDSGVVFVLTQARVTIGRGEENDVIVNDLKASRKHAELTVGPAGGVLVDAGSSHGTLINGAPQRQATLRNGDKIGLGETVLEYIGAQAGATQMLVTAPPRTAAAVGTGSSGLTQFIPRPSVASGASVTGAAAAQARPASFIEKNKKVVVVLGVLAAMAALLPEVEKKQRKERNEYSDPLQVDGGRQVAALKPPPVDESIERAARVHFKECFRELRARNYLRARIACETALQIHPDHKLANIYLKTIKIEMENEAKDHFDAARRDEEASRLEAALNRYDAVKRLFAKDQSNKYYKEADKRSVELQQQIEEREKN